MCYFFDKSRGTLAQGTIEDMYISCDQNIDDVNTEEDPEVVKFINSSK